MESSLKIGEIEKSSIAHKAYKCIKELILSKKIKDKINQEDIAELFGISRTPVVIALNQLASEGYLTQIAYRGFFIKKYSRKELEDLSEVRMIYEKLGAEKMIQDMSEDKIKKLRKFLEKFEEYYRKKDLAKYRELDISFHKYIVEHANNNYIISQYSKAIVAPYITSSFLPMDDSVKDHIKLIDGLISGDSNRAKQAIEKHIGSFQIDEYVEPESESKKDY